MTYKLLPPTRAAVALVASLAKRNATVRAGNDRAGGSRPARSSVRRELFAPPLNRAAASSPHERGLIRACIGHGAASKLS